MSVTTDALRSSFAMLDGMTRANLTGVDADSAGIRPADQANNALWIIGHIVYWRSRILELLGSEPVWSEGTNLEFTGVKLGNPPAAVGRDFDTLIADLKAARSATEQALEGDVPEEVRADLLSLALHEAYHVGQLGLLRRSMGLVGAVGE